jgi:hypothetical protein
MGMTLTIDQMGFCHRDERPLEGPLAYLASRPRRSGRQLSPPASEVFKSMAEASDQLLSSVLEARTSEEYRKAFGLSFPKYATISLSLSSFAQAMVLPEILDRLARESLCEMESDCREKATAAFGAPVRDQLLFTIWTVRRIRDLTARIYALKLDPSKRDEDAEFSAQFTFHALSAHFALDCLNMAMHNGRAVYPEVMDYLMNGLRSMVDAYTWARRGVSLRLPETEQSLEPVESDEEDEVLLASSMQDMALMLREDEGL